MHIYRYTQDKSLLSLSSSWIHLHIQMPDTHSPTLTPGTQTSSLTDTHTHTYTLTTDPLGSGLGHSGYATAGSWVPLHPSHLMHKQKGLSGSRSRPMVSPVADPQTPWSLQQLACTPGPSSSQVPVFCLSSIHPTPSSLFDTQLLQLDKCTDQ